MVISQFLAGELDIDGSAQAVEDGWNELNEQFGVDAQLSAYKATIGAE